MPVAQMKRLTSLSAPRFAEVWEKHPCQEGAAESPWPSQGHEGSASTVFDEAGAPGSVGREGQSTRLANEIYRSEYRRPFVGERDELLRWLEEKGLLVSKESRVMLLDYARQQMRFVALAVDIRKVRFFDDESARLSPIGYWVLGEELRLFARLGLPTLAQHHDLYVLALHPSRLRTKNYTTRFAPTNRSVDLFVRTRMAEFYNGLVDEFQSRHPVTFLQEYAWPALHCAAPCPTGALVPRDLAVLGATMPTASGTPYVLSRLHYRYTKDSLPADPEFVAGIPVSGGHALPEGPEGRADASVGPTKRNAFVTRFVHAHSFSRATACAHPKRFRWGAPPVPPPGRREIFIAEHMSRKSRDQIDLEQAVHEGPLRFSVMPGEATTVPEERGFRFGCGITGTPARKRSRALLVAFALGLVLAERRRRAFGLRRHQGALTTS
jgi:hypothetical protein